MKLKKTVSLILMLTIIVMSSAWCSGTRKTDKEQLAEVTKLATKRFVEEGHINRGETEKGKYTGLTVYPLYDENDEMQYFLIDLEPSGYAYVKSNIKVRSSRGCIWRNFICPYSDYTVSYGIPWFRYYRNETDTGFDYKDAEILYEDSHFKVANIGDEKRYLLKYYPKTGGFRYIPAVKRGDKFLNLVSTTEYDPNNLYEHEPIGNIFFMGKHAYDL